MGEEWSHFQKLRIIGRGAHGFAILCRRRRDGALVVVKEIFHTSDPTLTDAARRSSANEIQVLSMLRHSNIIAYYDSFVARGGVGLSVQLDHETSDEETTKDGGDKENIANPTSGTHRRTYSRGVGPAPGAASAVARADGAQRGPVTEGHLPSDEMALMIVMEYADGGTLWDYVKQRKEPLLERDVLLLFSQISLAIHHIHSHSIIHRDLKTNNIFVSYVDRPPADSTTSVQVQSMILKIGDFGISKVLDTGDSQADTVVGTPSYLSPELCEGKSYNEKSDIWAMGCILYEIASGRRMFDGATLPSIVFKIMSGKYEPLPSTYSMQLSNLIAWMCRPDPSDRPDAAAIVGLPFLQGSIVQAALGIGRMAFMKK
ncbi:kinase-like protein [Gonapodya prolifera JEL478]|uniref:non-specific serine/threonine protein kinase n=1 Tax=Gonapodya prolifera (strain JEL478) TaxID=1344416 RepID=A0A139ANR6_GONPJ|nr:kinase-like protein [Gonapodya prolifera JEL478]|eukprot:KXS18143.1 kinase-like protein [Gonapodya prolifera JEL478]